MSISFCMITDGKDTNRVNEIIDSIEANNIPPENYEIIVVGGEPLSRKNTAVVPFDETIKPSHITRKKNIAFKLAKFETIAIGHDYVSYAPNFYNSFLDFGDFDVAMVKILNQDNTRYTDWCTFDTPCGVNPDRLTRKWLDYDDHSKINVQYVSGTFWVCKKQYQLRYLLDESKSWGQSEDLAMSYAMRDNWNYRMNKNTHVKFIKQKYGCLDKTQEFGWKRSYGE